MNKPDFNTVTEFEKRIAEFFGAPYAVATDSCTSALELSLRYLEADYISVPKHTYISVPNLAKKLGINLIWREENWKDFYLIYSKKTQIVFDAAVLWRRDSYLSHSFMCLSFQYQKHLKIGRAGMILLDNKEAAIQLKKMSYDGREPNVPWRDQNISEIGYHYYLQPELAQIGLDKLEDAKCINPRKWTINDWPDLTTMKIFQ